MSHLFARWSVFVATGLIFAFEVSFSSASAASPRIFFACSEANDLYRVLGENGATFPHFATAAEAVRAVPRGSGVLVLADGYPQRMTPVTAALFEEATRKRLRLYVEYPAWLPDLTIGPAKQVKFERGVVASTFFGDRLPPLRIVLVGSCRYLPVTVAEAHLVAAKVAGMDRAVFGLEDAAAAPLLFDHPRGNLLVATTKLSQFVTGRYLPSDAWRTIWETILLRLQGGGPAPKLRWTPSVRPSYGPDDVLPADAEIRALRRSADWLCGASRTLRHPDWPKEALAFALANDMVRDFPRADWPRGDGSLGLLEGFSSTILPDGGQPMRYAVRNDCMSEAAMLLALAATITGRAEHAHTATKLVNYVFGKSGLAGGPRANPNSASYGLVGWSLDQPDTYYGDDNARAMLGVGVVAAVSNDHRWDELLVRNMLANFRTTGPNGFRPSSLDDKTMQAHGWKAYWTAKTELYSPHYQSWLWACYLWAYRQTRFEPLRTRSEAGLRAMIDSYPDRWDWCLRSGTIERSRLLLPLAWLVRAQDSPEHRRWLRTIAGDLLALQTPCGAIREVIGDGRVGVASNAAYGTGESTLIQADGDPVCDLLYSCNFALVGLHEAAAATGEPFYAGAEDKLARFLCRIQIRSDAHRELDGAWYRGFDFHRWEYWASSADWAWGPWCTETGWCQPWIAGTLALRQQGKSLWDLVQKVDLKSHFDRCRRSMLPEAARIVGHSLFVRLGATAGLSSSAESTVGQANRGTRVPTRRASPPAKHAVVRP